MLKNHTTAKVLQWEVVEQDAIIHIHLVGELTREHLLSLYEQQQPLLHKCVKAHQIYWDLKQVTRIDSAGFAFLCDLLHQSQTNLGGGDSLDHTTKQVVINNAPSQLLTLSDLFGLSAWVKQFLI
ncbi:phospholipid transport system transporter-binding protein [Volucribacter psittacicida]|uniref:Phospholipid transport system transporter-binding protein n=1 Tax=Volucribacter psittacicida TaxID=203482 RepID=A0A4R1FUF0_9PAST|nr:STAS domain-containing protein [Volucribacter psittacicida]TCJ97930.1 phospholipid transport system transporter-binding protein [Volucribacter psittacicida]